MELSILVYVLLLIAFARAFGEAATRVNQPPIVGELLAGIVLGPFVLGELLPSLEDMYTSEFLSNLADLGVLFLMLYVGMEFSSRRLLSKLRLGLVLSAAGILLPFVLGVAACFVFDIEGTTMLFVALAVSVTALPVTMRVLKDMEVLDTETSDTVVSAALVTDLVVLFAMSVILGDGSGDVTAAESVVLALGFIMFFVLAYVVGRFLVPHVYTILRKMQTGEAAFAVAILLAIAFAIAAGELGLPAFVGAFVAGLLLRETGRGLKVWARVEGILSGITLGFLAPVFFVLVGFTVDFGAIFASFALFVVVTAVAIMGKTFGTVVSARACGLGPNESMAVGSMMMGKGAMELVFALYAFDMGIIEEDLFSVLVLMAFASTLLAPALFKRYFNKAVLAGEVRRRALRTLKPHGHAPEL